MRKNTDDTHVNNGLHSCAAVAGLLLMLFSSGANAGEIVVYPAPTGADLADDFTVKAGTQEVAVYDSEVGALAYFSFGGKVTVTVVPKRQFEQVDIRPTSRKIAHTVQNGTIQFVLDRPGNFSIELDGDIERPLLIFASPFEGKRPQPGDEGVHYFEGGRIHDAGQIRVDSNETVYIAGGAIVRGRIRASGAQNVRVMGRGILDGSHRDYKTRMVEFVECANVLMDGIIVLNSYGWTVVPVKTDDVLINNVKIVGWRDNDDGVDIVGCHNLTVSRSFLRTKDDCIAVKASPGYFQTEAQSGMRDVRNVNVVDSVLWNAEWGNAMEIGFELQTESVSDVTFKNCDIIHVERGGTFTIHNGDYATVERIRFEDVRVEDSRDKLLELRVGLSIYSADCPWELHRKNPDRRRSPGGQWVPVEGAERVKFAKNRGHIRNVYLKNVQVFGKRMPKSYLIGYDSEHTVEGVLIENLTFNGMQIWDAQRGNFNVDKVKNIMFIGSGGR